jgi:hypothetical protein
LIIHIIHKILLFWAVHSLAFAFVFCKIDQVLDIFHDDMNFSPLIPFGCLISRQEA